MTWFGSWLDLLPNISLCQKVLDMNFWLIWGLFSSHGFCFILQNANVERVDGNILFLSLKTCVHMGVSVAVGGVEGFCHSHTMRMIGSRLRTIKGGNFKEFVPAGYRTVNLHSLKEEKDELNVMGNMPMNGYEP